MAMAGRSAEIMKLCGNHEAKATGKVRQPMSTNTELEHQPAGHQKPTTIVVNGRQKEVVAKELSFVDVVRLAFEDAVFNDTTVYTVT